MKTLLSTLAAITMAAAAIAAESEPDLDDLKVRERIIAKAQWANSFGHKRGPKGETFFYLRGHRTPYTGWMKAVENHELVLSSLTDGQLEGPLIQWYKNGRKKFEGTHKNGKKTGPWTTWAPNGRKRITHYKDGKQDGFETNWDENGKELSKRLFKDGKEVEK